MADYSEDYLLNKRVKIFQPTDGYRASTDAVLLAAAVNKIKTETLFWTLDPEPEPFRCVWPSIGKRRTLR